MVKFFLFGILLNTCLFSSAQEIKVGTKVEVTATDGKVYPATVKEIIHTAHRIHYDGYGDESDVWMTKDQFRVVAGAPTTVIISTENNATAQKATGWTVGSRVEAFSSKKWNPGTIAEIKDSKYRIRYDGSSEYWDTWVAANELRQPGENGGVKVSLDKAAPGKLYLRHIRWMTGGTSLNWYFFADNGTVVVDPKHGVNPVNLAAERADNMVNMGTYVITNNSLKVQWLNGTTSDVEVEYKNGELIRIDAFSIAMRQKGFPANYKLNGTYSGVSGVGNIAQGRNFNFSENGNFSVTNTGYVSNEATNNNASNTKSGSYRINGNTLTLQYADGSVEMAPIAIWEDRIVINNTSLPMKGN